MSTRPVPGLTLEQQPDDILLRLAIWGEARGEGPVGMLAVLWVIANRMSGGHLRAGQVILARNQFAAFAPDDPNHDKLLRAHVLEPLSWGRADAIVNLWAHELTLDPSCGATHYFARIAPRPNWAEPDHGWVWTATLGGHEFGRAA